MEEDCEGRGSSHEHVFDDVNIDQIPEVEPVRFFRHEGSHSPSLVIIIV